MKTTYINAGAGSGKTYRLTHDLADMLTREDNPIEASRVILTTFTKAAAQDFKKKAREVLIKEKHNPAKAAELDNALIGTVHSVCEKFVNKYWYRLGLTLPLNLISEDEKKLYVSRTAENVASDGDIKYFTQFARDYEMNADFWKDYLKGIVLSKLDFGVEGLQKSCEISCRDIAAVFTNDAAGREEFMDVFLKTMVSAIEAMNRVNKANGKEEKLLKELKEAQSLLAGASLYRKALKIQGWATKGKEMKKGFWKDTFDTSAFSAVEDAAQCVFLSKNVGDDCQSCVRKLFKLAEDWEREYQRFKDENSLLDFNDLEQKFLRILYEEGFDDVRRDIKKSFDLLMVDEFQDSNPVQIKIFRKLMELVEKSVFVGDRKQAIFGFRGTESSLVEDFIKDIAEGDKESLKQSYRSRPELVDAASDTFCQAFKVKREKDPKKPYDGVSLKAVRPAREDLGPALQFWLAPLKSEGSKKSDYTAVGKKISEIVKSGTYLVVRDKDEEGNEIVEPIQFRDIALLLRFNSGIYEAAQAFREVGVPVSIQEAAFSDWAEVQLILSLVRYVSNAGDLCAKADILHLIQGLASEDIIASTADRQPVKEAAELFEKLDKIRSRISVLSISEIVETLTLELDIYGNTKGWGQSDTRARNVGFMTELARQYERRCANMNTSPSLPGYISYVSNYKPEGHLVDRANTVKVLTYHSAKGLEWPMVILDELDSLSTDEQEIFRKDFSGIRPFRDKNSDQVLLHVFPGLMSKKSTGKFNANTNLPDTLIKRLSNSAFFNYVTDRKKDEEKRLLYVGFTRAKDYLVTLGNSKSLFTWPVLCNAGESLEGRTELLWHSAHPSTYFVLQKPESAIQSKDGALEAWDVPSKRDPDDKYISPSRAGQQKPAAGVPSTPVALTDLFNGKKMIQNIQGDIEESEAASPENKSALCGTCIHRIFAAYDPGRDRAELVAIAGRIIAGMGLTAEFPSPESVVDSAAQFFGWLRQTYGDATALHELPFVKRQPDGTVVRGEMDLVWELPGKKCILVDYKSFQGSEELGGIKAHAVQHGYPAQLKTYKETLEAGGYKVQDVLIYYLVQGRIVKFEV